MFSTIMAAEIIDKKLHIDGHIYYRSREANGRVYWDCVKTKSKECTARAITTRNAAAGTLTVVKGPAESIHSHPPNREEVEAQKLVERVKRRADEHPEERPAQLLRAELQGTSRGVLSQLPEQTALARTIRRVRRRNLPTAPTRLAELEAIPDRYQKTFLGEQFVLYDSRDDEEANNADPDDDGGAWDSDPDDADAEDADFDNPDDEEEARARRVIVFATRRNIELLCESSVWFVDGTFKTSPLIFTQLFTIIGLRTRAGSDESVAIPLIYALLSGKSTDMYAKVLKAVKSAVEQYHVHPCVPTKIMSDFELAIMNACRKVFPHVPVSGCFFHLGQTLYRRVQVEGLQGRYNDKDDRSVKMYTHMLLALAFVPVADVPRAFRKLRRECPQELLPVYDFFNTTYISGRPARGRRRAVAPRYEPATWNQHAAALAKSHRTNNYSEGWHNRFQQVVGKHHPDLYSALKEIQQEQGFAEICVAELAMGRRVKSAPRKKWTDLQVRLEHIAAEYNREEMLEYLENVANNVNIS